MVDGFVVAAAAATADDFSFSCNLIVCIFALLESVFLTEFCLFDEAVDALLGLTIVIGLRIRKLLLAVVAEVVAYSRTSRFELLRAL